MVNRVLKESVAEHLENLKKDTIHDSRYYIQKAKLENMQGDQNSANKNIDTAIIIAIKKELRKKLNDTTISKEGKDAAGAILKNLETKY